MTTPLFALLGAALALVAAGALAWPLRRASPRLAIALLVAVPVLALSLYQIVGTPAGLASAPRAAEATLESAIAGLRQDLARDPRQIEGWQLLGRALTARGEAAGARDAFARAAALDPSNDEAAVDLAEASALAADGRRFDAATVALLETVVARTPGHQRARWFLGIARRQAGDDAGAVDAWTPLLGLVDGATAVALRPQLDAARAAAGLAPLAAADADAVPPAGAAADGGIVVEVSLAPALAARLPADASVFVVARVPGGPPMPVAVERHRVDALPLRVLLDDGDSPMPTQALSSLAEVEVSARVSLSGDAARGDGDIESAPVRVPLPAAAPVVLVVGAPR